MNKREFLAVGGAVPLMLAGCGGSGSGSAPVRLVNASVGYETGLGFMVESTQATTSDVAYGAVSPFETVEAGSVDVTLNQGGSSVTSAQTRTIGKGTRYSLVAYGKVNELKSVLITESTTTPDTGKANINVLNVSTDIGAVDVYLSSTLTSPYVNQIDSNRSGVSQGSFTPMVPGDYYITVVGYLSVAKNLNDIRFQSTTKYTLVDQKTYTIILTPGASGVLANAIVLQQDNGGTSTSFTNSTSRVRAVTATGGLSVTVQGSSTTSGTTSAVNILSSATGASAQYSEYKVVNTGTAPTVVVGGTTLTVHSSDWDGVTATASIASLAAGGDYTLLIYVDSNGNPVAKAVEDDNTSPASSSGAKFRLINLAYNNPTSVLSMSVNSLSAASSIAFATASDYTEYTPPQTVSSTVEVFDGSDLLITRSQVLTLANIFTEIVVKYDSSAVNASKDFFRAAASSTTT